MATYKTSGTCSSAIDYEIDRVLAEITERLGGAK